MVSGICPQCGEKGVQRVTKRLNKSYMDYLHVNRKTCHLGLVKTTNEVMKEWGFGS